ncbi:uncharacterized protein [Periplaneta americana]|uniref:uncharacterized protein isoform X2 n=1 Tax=Periplaneta americana TaxID=6978 RepID=UPI0037E79532
MTDLLIQSVTSRGDTFPRSLLDGCRSSVVSRYSRSGDSLSSELKHSKSDDLVLQSAAIIPPEIQHARCDSPIPKTACVVYEDDLVSTHVLPKPKYFSDSETDEVRSSCVDKPPRKVSGDFSDVQRISNRHMGLYDRVDPEDSIRDMITENDFYRFVLFKKHYEKYLHLSQKYEEARNIAYYLEEKYHEVKAERDGLTRARQELERKLETKELELHEKEEELFLQLEKVVRLEEDFEKLRAEKEKFGQWKDKLEREKNEAYRQLKRQAAESEATRRGLERARQEVVRQVTAIAAEKDSLEKEVTELKFIARQSASLNNQFKKGMKHLAMCKRKKCSVCAYTKATFGDYVERSSDKKQLLSCFQAPLQDLRNWIRPVPLAASSSSDKYSSASEDCDGPGARGERRLSTVSGYSAFLGHSSPFPSTRSEYSFRRAYSSEETQTSTSSPSPSPSLPIDLTGEMALGAGGGLTLPPYISYIDEVSTSSSSESSSGDSGHGEESSSFNMLDAAAGGPPCHCAFGNPSNMPPTDTSLTSTSSNMGAGPSMPAAATSRAFSSDSGFSSELYDTTGGHRSLSTSRGGTKINGVNDDADKPTPGLHRSKWTASFRKLINRVSKR